MLPKNEAVYPSRGPTRNAARYLAPTRRPLDPRRLDCRRIAPS